MSAILRGILSLFWVSGEEILSDTSSGFRMLSTFPVLITCGCRGLPLVVYIVPCGLKLPITSGRPTINPGSGCVWKDRIRSNRQRAGLFPLGVGTGATRADYSIHHRQRPAGARCFGRREWNHPKPNLSRAAAVRPCRSIFDRMGML